MTNTEPVVIDTQVLRHPHVLGRPLLPCPILFTSKNRDNPFVPGSTALQNDLGETLDITTPSQLVCLHKGHECTTVYVRTPF